MLESETIRRLRTIASMSPPTVYPPDQRAEKNEYAAQCAFTDAVRAARHFFSETGIAACGVCWELPWECQCGTHATD